MRAPVLDDRLQVHCEWTGAPGASESIARLHGLEIAQNRFAGGSLRYGRVGNWLGLPPIQTDETGRKYVTQSYGWGIRAQEPLSVADMGKIYAFGIDAKVIESTLSYANLRISALEVTTRIPNDGEWHRAVLYGFVPEDAESLGGYFLASRVDETIAFSRFSLALAETSGEAIALVETFFDGDTIDPETLMGLYDALRGTPPPRLICAALPTCGCSHASAHAGCAAFDADRGVLGTVGGSVPGRKPDHTTRHRRDGVCVGATPLRDTLRPAPPTRHGRGCAGRPNLVKPSVLERRSDGSPQDHVRIRWEWLPSYVCRGWLGYQQQCPHIKIRGEGSALAEVPDGVEHDLWHSGRAFYSWPRRSDCHLLATGGPQ